MRKWIKRGNIALVATASAAAGIWFAWPQPVPVDIATVTRSTMEVTVDDEARTRVRHVYTVSAPLAGKVLRSPREVGDNVRADQTVVAIMQPASPAFHDPRTHEQLQAALAAAVSGVTAAKADERKAEAALAYSQSELRRAQALFSKDGISRKDLDQAQFNVDTNEAALAAAKAQLQFRSNERVAVAVAARNPTASSGRDSASLIEIRAPVSGSVLKLDQESETVVQPGTPLIEIGNPQDLEINAELLSSDVVQIKPDATVHIDGWGGPLLEGRVRLVEPSGFLKVSALGIEEQRVRTIIDFADDPESWQRLGHDYRVIVHVVIWKGENVVTVPVGALFRDNDNWAVFAVVDGRANLAPVKVGHRNNRTAEIVEGLSAGARVVLHPSDRVSNGTRVASR
ncbi:MAG TPA: efflux RND transporter periplasmic adaptor subunit [Candidatus Binataceae bacterium]|nr:efflux RND transporter periplasmic adaptor subunit [Candidatus Binataceae bacterium]